MCNYGGSNSNLNGKESDDNEVFNYNHCTVNGADGGRSLVPDDVDDDITAIKRPHCTVPSPLLPALDNPVPDKWVTLEGEFVLVCAVYQTHLGDDSLVSPQSRINDEIIYLMIIKKGVSKKDLLKVLLEFETGSHVDLPYVELVPVLAFRIEPESSKGNIMVDGETVPVAPIQAQVLPGLAKIMAIR